MILHQCKCIKVTTRTKLIIYIYTHIKAVRIHNGRKDPFKMAKMKYLGKNASRNAKSM